MGKNRLLDLVWIRLPHSGCVGPKPIIVELSAAGDGERWLSARG